MTDTSNEMQRLRVAGAASVHDLNNAFAPWVRAVHRLVEAGEWELKGYKSDSDGYPYKIWKYGPVAAPPTN